MAAVVVTAKRGHVAIGPDHNGKQFVVESLPSGDILLRRHSLFIVRLLEGGDTSIDRVFVDTIGNEDGSVRQPRIETGAVLKIGA
ncbi:MAG: hypothetical protein JNN20_20155 [Betaproteobacteria bacterium]|nr:hypothetical protein [Betaproteobacteria bacterium]